MQGPQKQRNIKSARFLCEEVRIKCKYVDFKAPLIKMVKVTATCLPPKYLEKYREGNGYGFKVNSKVTQTCFSRTEEKVMKSIHSWFWKAIFLLHTDDSEIFVQSLILIDFLS